MALITRRIAVTSIRPRVKSKDRGPMLGAIREISYSKSNLKRVGVNEELLYSVAAGDVLKNSVCRRVFVLRGCVSA